MPETILLELMSRLLMLEIKNGQPVTREAKTWVTSVGEEINGSFRDLNHLHSESPNILFG